MKIMSCPIMKPPVVLNISFPNPRLEKEDIRGIYGECGQKSMIESDHKDQINYPHGETYTIK
jgi:hypothetical protein